MPPQPTDDQTPNHDGEHATAREPGDERRRKPFPPQRPWEHDNLAGVERLTYSDADKKIYEVWLKFRDGKPSEEVRRYLKDNGFHWEPNAPEGGRFGVKGAWARSTAYATLGQDRLHGERVYRKVAEMIRAEKGLTPEQSQSEGVPF